MTEIKGYKATLWSGMPKHGFRRTPYKVGGVYSVKPYLVLCKSGLHFCKRLCDVYGTYDSAFYTRVFEVESRGVLRFGEDKVCTDCLKFTRELTPAEILMQLAHDANHLDTAKSASFRVMSILHSVIAWEKALDNTPEWVWCEWHHMLVSYRANRRLQWAQAFNEYRFLPVCRLAMNACAMTDHKLEELVETLRQDPILQSDNDKEEKKE